MQTAEGESCKSTLEVEGHRKVSPVGNSNVLVLSVKKS